MTGRTLLLICAGAAVASFILPPAALADITLNDYGDPQVSAMALDQPRLNAVVTDNGNVIRENGQAVVLNAFIDTGASGVVISNLNAVGYNWLDLLSVPSLGLTGSPGQFIGHYTEIGIGGTEVGDVTGPYGLRVINGAVGDVSAENYDANAAQFVNYGNFNFWVRRAPGVGEISDVMGPDPVNIVGMPVIGQRVMVMDPTPLADLSLMITNLLPAGNAGIPTNTNVTFSLRMQDFVGTPPAGEAAPSHAANPVVLNVSASHTVASTGVRKSITGQEWLFDTGSASTFVGLEEAWGLGLIPQGMNMADFLVQHTAAGGIVLPVGGIGPSVDAPLLHLDEIRVPNAGAKEDIIWHNVDVLVVDVPGLSGVFGLNLLLPSATVDPADPLGGLGTISPGYFDSIVFDPAAAQLRMKLGFTPPPVTGDFNADRRLTPADVDLLYAHLGTAVPPTDAMYDLSPNGHIDAADVTSMFQTVLETSPADTNLDHAVNLLDLVNLAHKYGQKGGFADGDTNGDGIMNLIDLVNMARDYGKRFDPVGAADTVPEPSSLLFLAAGAFAALGRRKSGQIA
jgi:hypothetical protein